MHAQIVLVTTFGRLRSASNGLEKNRLKQDMRTRGKQYICQGHALSSNIVIWHTAANNRFLFDRRALGASDSKLLKHLRKDGKAGSVLRLSRCFQTDS